MNGVVNPLNENLNLNIATIHLVEGFTRLGKIVSQLEIEFLDIDFYL